VVDAPPVEPIGLPPIAPGERTEPFLPVRVVVGLGMDSASAAGPLDWRAVEEPPALLAGRPPAYPELLRAAGIEGRVVLEVVIDTLGRAEGAARVVESSNRGFEAAARAYVQGALFRPGRVGGGRAVRVLPEPGPGPVRAHDSEGRLVALGHTDPLRRTFVPEKVLS
jgi:protein TonB